ncbi:MAG: FecR domain-containing protein [Cytophagales bacterium]|nr:FecR domain-containing protein [Cytophagales bacterium]
MTADYRSYSASDFASDDFFQRWVLAPDGEAESFWQSFLGQHPEKAEAVAEARTILLHLGQDADAPPAGRKGVVWGRIQDELAAESERAAAPRTKVLPLWQKWVAAVAAMLLLVVGYQFLRGTPDARLYATGSGEKKVVMLPDSSEVTLNAQSSLRLAEAWNHGESRQVWLRGEAFFKVRKKPGAGNARFIVHTSDLTVEVLGTSFNVDTRAEGTRVVLSEGKVKINPADGTADRPVFMAPGEAVTVSAGRKITKTVVKPELYTAWKRDELVLNKTTLREIGLFIRENYGLTVTYQNDTLPALVLDGTALPTGDRDAFLKAVTTTLGIGAEIKDNRLHFKP